jgi:hypothetical protein
MFSLVYPAVLGAVFYLLLPALTSILPYTRSRQEVKVGFVKSMAGWLVVIHFAIDFQLAGSVPGEQYGLPAFLLDFSVLLALFVAFDAINLGSAHEIQVRWAALAMAVGYGLFLLWSLFALNLPLDLRPLRSIEAAGLLLFAIVAWKPRPTLLCLVLLVMAVAMAGVGSVTVSEIRGLTGAAM